VDPARVHVTLDAERLSVLHRVPDIDFDIAHVADAGDDLPAPPIEDVHQSLAIAPRAHDAGNRAGDLDGSALTTHGVKRGTGQDEILLDQYLVRREPVIAEPARERPWELDLLDPTADIGEHASTLAADDRPVHHPHAPAVPRMMQHEAVEPGHRLVQLRTLPMDPDRRTVSIARRSQLLDAVGRRPGRRGVLHGHGPSLAGCSPVGRCTRTCVQSSSSL